MTPEEKFKLADTRIACVAQQRNNALDLVAYWQTEAALAQEKIKLLEARVAELSASSLRGEPGLADVPGTEPGGMREAGASGGPVVPADRGSRG